MIYRKILRSICKLCTPTTQSVQRRRRRRRRWGLVHPGKRRTGARSTKPADGRFDSLRVSVQSLQINLTGTGPGTPFCPFFMFSIFIGAKNVCIAFFAVAWAVQCPTLSNFSYALTTVSMHFSGQI